MDWLAVSAVRMIIAVAAIPAIVRARHGVKTESAQWDCDLECTKGMFAKIKPCGFTLFARRYGVDVLLDCLEKNEKNGVIETDSNPQQSWGDQRTQGAINVVP